MQLETNKLNVDTNANRNGDCCFFTCWCTNRLPMIGEPPPQLQHHLGNSKITRLCPPWPRNPRMPVSLLRTRWATLPWTQKTQTCAMTTEKRRQMVRHGVWVTCARVHFIRLFVFVSLVVGLLHPLCLVRFPLVTCCGVRLRGRT